MRLRLKWTDMIGGLFVASIIFLIVYSPSGNSQVSGGTLSGGSTCASATSSSIGCVKPDNTTITIASGVLSAASAASAASVPFSGVSAATNGNALLIGTGGSLGTSGTGTIAATSASGAIAATTLSASSTVSGSGFSTYLASPPAIGGTAQAAGTFDQINWAGNLSIASSPTSGFGMITSTPTYNDTSGTGGTISNIFLYAWPAPILTAQTPTTYTNVFGLNILNPTCSTNATCTNITAIQTPTINVTTSANITLNGSLIMGRKIIIVTSPTVTSGLGTSPTVTGLGTAAFRIVVGSSGTPSTSVVIGMPTATTGWICQVWDMTTTADVGHQSAVATTSVTFTFNTAPANSDTLLFTCMGF